MSEEAVVQLRERVKAPPAKELVDAYYSHAVAAGKRYVFPHEMRVHLAHTLMLGDRGIIPQSNVGPILRTILDLVERGPEALQIDYTQEDLYSYVERHVVKVLGPDVGGRMHTARSRNDLNVTSWHLVLREHLLGALDALNALRRGTLKLAADHATTVMPGYTHTQHAQPISLGYYLLSYADVLGRDCRRLAAALATCDASPLGAGALSTTAFPIDRQATADMLGFAGLVEVAYDAVSSRDDMLEAVAAAAILMTGLSRVATDLQTWNTMEFGFIELADAYSATSSIMPQKKNPQAMEFIKSAAASVTGALTTVLACAKNTAFADVNDGVTAVNVPGVEAIQRLRSALVVMEGVLATLSVRPDAMRHSAAIGFGSATELADVIVRETGMSFRKAHNIVGRVVREAIDGGKPATAITPDDLDRAALALFGSPVKISVQAVTNALDPDANIRVRTGVGGPAPDNVLAMIEVRHAALDNDEAALAKVNARVTTATSRLLERARHTAASR